MPISPVQFDADGQTLRLDQEDFYDVMEERGEMLRNILRMLCQRIRRQNEKMHELAR